jgi:plastocyanin
MFIMALLSLGGCEADPARPDVPVNVNPQVRAGDDTGQEYVIMATDDMQWTSAYFEYSKPMVIPVGSTVRWTSYSNMVHSVVSEGEFDKAYLGSNSSGMVEFEHTFVNRGTFEYHCGEHMGMSGTIVVVNRYGE